MVPMHQKLLARFVVVIACALAACSKELPPAPDGYFILDGQKYPVLQAGIFTDRTSTPGAASFDSEVYFQGAADYYVTVSTRSPERTLSTGTYPFEYFFSANPMKLIYYKVRCGGSSKDYSSDAQSTGSMTLTISGTLYNFDFTGRVLGHDIQFHYSGKVEIH